MGCVYAFEPYLSYIASVLQRSFRDTYLFGHAHEQQLERSLPNQLVAHLYLVLFVPDGRRMFRDNIRL